MTVKMREGYWYKLSNGIVAGPATVWDNGVEHPFKLDVKSDRIPKDGYTLFREDGTTNYANFHIVAEVAAPSLVQAGSFYKTNGGMTVGPMVEDEKFNGRFTSAGNELNAIRNDGITLNMPQSWNSDGTVYAGNRHEESHELVERVEGLPFLTPSTGEPIGVNNAISSTLEINLSAKDFADSFTIVADEFSAKIEAVKAESESKDATIAELTESLRWITKNRDYCFSEWKKAFERKERGDNRLRAARQRLKAAKAFNAELIKSIEAAVERSEKAEAAESSKKVKAVVDALGGIFLLAATALATWAIVA